MKNDIIIKKLVSYSEKILTYCESLDYDSFSSNSMLVEACVFNLSQMGELVKFLDDSFMEIHKEIPWRMIYGLRNRIVHDYEGVNLALIWQIISEDLPELVDNLKGIV